MVHVSVQLQKRWMGEKCKQFTLAEDFEVFLFVCARQPLSPVLPWRGCGPSKSKVVRRTRLMRRSRQGALYDMTILQSAVLKFASD